MLSSLTCVPSADWRHLSISSGFKSGIEYYLFGIGQAGFGSPTRLSHCRPYGVFDMKPLCKCYGESGNVRVLKSPAPIGIVAIMNSF